MAFRLQKNPYHRNAAFSRIALRRARRLLTLMRTASNLHPGGPALRSIGAAFALASLSVGTVAARPSVSFVEDPAKTTPTVLDARAEASSPKKTEPQRHPLKGVIVGVYAEKKALLVKHEAIPGVMRAMTMLLQTDDATLRTAKEGQAISALLVRKDNGWWIESVKTVD